MNVTDTCDCGRPLGQHRSCAGHVPICNYCHEIEQRMRHRCGGNNHKVKGNNKRLVIGVIEPYKVYL